MKDFDGSSIEEKLFRWFLSTFPAGATIVELGSGSGSTKHLGELFNLFSIEDDKQYIDKYRSTYIYAAKKNGWYDPEAIRKNLPNNYDAILIDGPVGEGNRIGFLKNIHLFKTKCHIIVHDTHRGGERDLANKISKELSKKIIIDEGSYCILL